jgi:hypothetical protein
MTCRACCLTSRSFTPIVLHHMIVAPSPGITALLLNHRSARPPTARSTHRVTSRRTVRPAYAGPFRSRSQHDRPTCLDQGIKPSQRHKTSHSPLDNAMSPSTLTRRALHQLSEIQDDDAAVFDAEIRTRAIQEAGQQLGFTLKLDCYEQAASTFAEWLQSRHILFAERPIFKEKDDIRAVLTIAQALSVRESMASNRPCEA